MSKQTTIKCYKLKNNETRYMFQIYIGVDPLTGKEKSTTRRGFKTKKEAKDALAQLKVEINKGTFKKKQLEIYQDLYEMWINHYENTVEESTFIKTTASLKIIFYLQWVHIKLIKSMLQYAKSMLMNGQRSSNVSEW